MSSDGSGDRDLIRISPRLKQYLTGRANTIHCWQVVYFQRHDSAASSWFFRWSAPFVVGGLFLFAAFGFFFYLERFVPEPWPSIALGLFVIWLLWALGGYFRHAAARRALKQPGLSQKDRERHQRTIGLMPLGSSRALWIALFFAFSAVATQASLLIWRDQAIGMQDQGLWQWILMDAYLLASGLTLGLSAIWIDPSEFVDATFMADKILVKCLEIFMALGAVAYIVHFLRVSRDGYETVEETLGGLADYLLYAHHADRDNVRVCYVGEKANQHALTGEHAGAESLIRLAKDLGHDSIWTRRKTDKKFFVLTVAEAIQCRGEIPCSELRLRGSTPAPGPIRLRVPWASDPIETQLQQTDGIGVALCLQPGLIDELTNRFKMEPTDAIAVQWQSPRTMLIWPARFGEFVSAEDSLG